VNPVTEELLDRIAGSGDVSHLFIFADKRWDQAAMEAVPIAIEKAMVSGAFMIFSNDPSKHSFLLILKQRHKLQ
jgi:hypothetical protein